MIKKPYTYLFYAVICFLLFAVGYYEIIICHTRAEWWVVLIPLTVGIVLSAVFLKGINKH